MARLPRLTLPGHPHHIIQRGNNRQPICLTDADYQLLLDLLGAGAKKFNVALHAYVVIANHFHLVATPQTESGLSALMQAVGRSYVRYFNQTHHRSGTLWDGRYKSTVIQAERYLLPCMVHMDLNPVRDGLVTEAPDYPWSSSGHYCGKRVDRLIKPHPLVWALGNTPFAREAAYTELVRKGVSQAMQMELTDAMRSGWALGEPHFVADLQKKTERRLTRLPAGRPVTRGQLEAK